MPDLEKKVEKSSGGGFTLATVISGIFISLCMDDYASKFFGVSLIAAGVGTLWVDGYSPIKITKEFLEGTGKLACLPYDYIKKKYKKEESSSANSKVAKS